MPLRKPSIIGVGAVGAVAAMVAVIFAGSWDHGPASIEGDPAPPAETGDPRPTQGVGGGSLARSPQEVTPEQMLAAIAAQQACLEAAGVEVELVFPGEGMRLPVRRLHFSASGPEDSEAVAAANRAITDCWEEHLADLDEAWKLKINPTTEDIEEMYRWMETCVANGGVPRHGEVPQDALVLRQYGPAVAPRFIPDFPPGSLMEVRQCFVEQQATTGYAWPLITKSNEECPVPPGGADEETVMEWLACKHDMTVEEMRTGPSVATGE